MCSRTRMVSGTRATCSMAPRRSLASWLPGAWPKIAARPDVCAVSPSRMRILHLGFGQRGAVLDAPVYRLEALVHVALVQEIDERAGDHRLIPRAHRQVRSEEKSVRKKSR